MVVFQLHVHQQTKTSHSFKFDISFNRLILPGEYHKESNSKYLLSANNNLITIFSQCNTGKLDTLKLTHTFFQFISTLKNIFQS
ncbi:hypothetical protein HOB94_02015 [bacterium]|nr:hypothetical protein [bacterium]